MVLSYYLIFKLYFEKSFGFDSKLNKCFIFLFDVLTIHI